MARSNDSRSCPIVIMLPIIVILTIVTILKPLNLDSNDSK